MCTTGTSPAREYACAVRDAPTSGDRRSRIGRSPGWRGHLRPTLRSKDGYDHPNTKDVNESSSGKHGRDDTDDRDDK